MALLSRGNAPAAANASMPRSMKAPSASWSRGFRPTRSWDMSRPAAARACRRARPNNLYPTADDSYIHITAMGEAVFRRLAGAMGQPGLADDPRFRDAVSRSDHHDDLDELIGEWTSSCTLAALEATLAQGQRASNPHLHDRRHLRRSALPGATGHRRGTGRRPGPRRDGRRGAAAVTNAGCGDTQRAPHRPGHAPVLR